MTGFQARSGSPLSSPNTRTIALPTSPMFIYSRQIALACFWASIGLYLFTRALLMLKPGPLESSPRGVSPMWDVGALPSVSMFVENSRHYGLDSPDANTEWAALVPSEDGVIHIGPEKTPFLPAIFHQLKCLDIIRQAYLTEGTDGNNSLPRHCLNYLRQSLLCRTDLRLEPVVDPFGPHAVQPYGRRTCQDWRVVYKAFEDQMDF
ncbi:hypothetical protein PC9H_003065 [Pleurotus ostreatus]|uniref:Oxidase ustYa n=1 Tax=Pleurotus ostreatus TaxID=5322 RepID=A0A8H7DXM9_PLEOS|nr:uncharacterized protein PC9H_003065 [Pleurotus ostreatus]KAF7436236.1 hypothetical protein PC9H_003065 [Pleurotus ostreatus]KAJ8701887.1 hypothetical protein PTI98_000641 [Pleurotus ostreatus]